MLSKEEIAAIVAEPNERRIIICDKNRPLAGMERKCDFCDDEIWAANSAMASKPDYYICMKCFDHHIPNKTFAMPTEEQVDELAIALNLSKEEIRKRMSAMIKSLNGNTQN